MAEQMLVFVSCFHILQLAYEHFKISHPKWHETERNS